MAWENLLFYILAWVLLIINLKRTSGEEGRSTKTVYDIFHETKRRFYPELHPMSSCFLSALSNPPWPSMVNMFVKNIHYFQERIINKYFCQDEAEILQILKNGFSILVLYNSTKENLLPS